MYSKRRQWLSSRSRLSPLSRGTTLFLDRSSPFLFIATSRHILGLSLSHSFSFSPLVRVFHRKKRRCVHFSCTRPIQKATNAIEAREFRGRAHRYKVSAQRMLDARFGVQFFPGSPDLSYFISTDFDRNQLL